MAAAVAGRTLITYFTYGDKIVSGDIVSMTELVVESGSTVAELWKYIRDYDGLRNRRSADDRQSDGLYQFIITKCREQCLF